jgi:sporulation protein YlmC with PRC-barrel domain
MRLSELIGSEVRDGNDREIGRVVDVRVVHEPASVDGSLGSMRVSGLVVARGRRIRIGRPDQRGPAAFKLLDRWSERRRRFVPWDAVESARRGSIIVRLSVA